MRKAWGLLSGVAAAAVVVLLRRASVLEHAPALVLALLLVLALPTSRLLGRRILLMGLLLAGWVPVLWWVRLPVGSTGRVTLLLGLAAAAVGWSAVTQPRAILPKWSALDVLPIAAAFAALLPLRTWLRANDPAVALSFFDSGWDNAAHFNMTAMIREHGVTIDRLGLSPDGSAWAFAHYPQTFHATMATIIELLRGPATASRTAELVPYAHAEALLFALVVGFVVAGMISVRSMRQRPLFAVASSSLVIGILVFGVGAALLVNANLNYLLALAAVIGACELAIIVARPFQPLLYGAMAGALISVANGWSLLVVVALPAVLAALLPWQRRRLRVRRGEWPMVALITIGLAAAAVHSIGVVFGVNVSSFLTIPGYTPLEPPSRVLAIVLVSLLAGVAPMLRGRYRVTIRTPPGRVAVLALVPFTALLMAAAVGLLELPAGHGLTYYFWKLFTGLEIISLPLGLIAISRLARPARLTYRTVRTATLLVALVGWQAFGVFLPIPWANKVHYTLISPMLQNVAISDFVSAIPDPVAQHLISSVPLRAKHPGKELAYLPVAPYEYANAANANEWYWTLNGIWTTHPGTMSFPPLVVKGVKAAALILDRGLQGRPDVLVLVSPDIVGQVRSALKHQEFREQILVW